MSRHRIIENPRAFSGREEAMRIRKTFQDADPETEVDMPWRWPSSLRCIGVGYSVMYRSNKWKRNKNEYEDYKHLCESRKPWELYAAPGFTLNDQRGRPIPLFGKTKEIGGSSMPENFATLANCLGVQGRIYAREGSRLVLPDGDENLLQIEIPRAKLGSGKTRSGHVFLCVYVESEGPKLFIFGTDLDVEKDGIVG